MVASYEARMNGCTGAAGPKGSTAAEMKGTGGANPQRFKQAVTISQLL